MHERDKRRIGEEIEPGDRPKAPGRLELLQRFLNTWNHELPTDWDRLGTAMKATAWLHAKGLITSSARVDGNEAARLRELREALRALAMSNHRSGASASGSGFAGRLWPRARLRVEVDDAGRTRLEPSDSGVDAAVATLLGILHEAQVLGHWPRMKACRHCHYAFYDRSKNRSAAWCAMSICGNRTKNRTYRHRRSVA
jgi:predicted RNA-binding Zn ribbon-like protein